MTDRKDNHVNPKGRAFTSDLSGQEFWLILDKGYEPMGLFSSSVIGISACAGAAMNRTAR